MPESSIEREYVSVEALKDALVEMMKRKGIESWLQTAFDATDIEWLIDSLPDREYITIRVSLVHPDEPTL